MSSKADHLFRMNGKIVARLVGNEVVKHVQGSKHFLRKPRAIAFDAQVITEAEAVGAAALRVGDIETGKVYWVSMQDFLAGCLTIDRGFGRQAALPMEKWELVTLTGVPDKPVIEAEDKSDDHYTQLSLF